MHAIARSILPGDLVFDVGANQGDKTEWYAFRNVHVVAVEPQPSLAAKLKARFVSNPFVTIVEKGLATASGMLPMSISSNHVLSTFSDEWKTGRFSNQFWESTEIIEVTTLDNLITQYGTPRYIKIDVEGFEKQVVSGLSQKAGVLSFEFTSEFFVNAKDICFYLERLGYRHFTFSIGEEEKFETDAGWVNCHALLNLLSSNMGRDDLLWGDIYVA